MLSELIQLITTCFPRDEGWGWNIAKMHAFARMPSYILRFGSANNFSGQIGERALKCIVKDHAIRTQRRPDKFAEQCTTREYEQNVVNYVMQDMNGSTKSASVDTPSATYTTSGRFTVHLSSTNNRGMGIEDDRVVWHDRKKRSSDTKVSDLLLFAIRQYSYANRFTREFSLTGYTTMRLLHESSTLPVVYYASECINRTQRYDFALINFKCSDDTTNTCPGKILGFIRYNLTLGIPTPHFIIDEELSIEEIQRNLSVDENTYVVVHTPSDYVSLDDLQSKFVIPFVLGDILDCLYIVKIEAIHGPLFVFSNYGAIGNDAKKLFCSLPQRDWEKYFSNNLN